MMAKELAQMIDLRSDTITQPTLEMRRAMARAEVGDDVYGEDSTVNLLQEKVADLLGKEEALLVTSGTQGNQVSILTHCPPGSEAIVELNSHIFLNEAGAAAALAGVQLFPVPGCGGPYRGRDPGGHQRGGRASSLHLIDLPGKHP